MFDDVILRARYDILEEIGHGGQGRIYRGIQKATGQVVAIKVLDSPTRSAGDWQRLAREARLCAALHHPHIIRLIDAHQADGVAWLTFEWIPGRNLAEVLREEGHLRPAEAVRLMGQVLDALAAAHSRGVVHRDIKPSNIMVTRTGARRNTKVLDFGVGTLAAGRQTIDIGPEGDGGAVVGTPRYAAPEQLRGEAPTVFSDVYAWALTFIECLTGARVISGSRLSHIIVQQLGPRPIELPPGLREHRIGPILSRALEKDVSRRTVSASSLLSMLDSLDTHEIDALAAHGSPPQATSTTEAESAEPTMSPEAMIAHGEGRIVTHAEVPQEPVAADDRAFLDQVRFLRQLTGAERDRLAGALYRRTLHAGQVLAEQGEQGFDAYLVREGELTLELPVYGRQTRLVTRMGPATLVGEVCLVEAAPRTLRICASTSTTVYVLDGRRFAELCDQNDPGAHKILRLIALTLCDRLRQTTVRLQQELRGEEPIDRAQVAAGLIGPVPGENSWRRLTRLFRRGVR